MRKLLDILLFPSCLFSLSVYNSGKYWQKKNLCIIAIVLKGLVMRIKNPVVIIIFTAILISVINGNEQPDNKTVSFEPNIKKLASGFKFTEGPAADKEGNIYFTDIPNSRIHKWSLKGKLSTFKENSGRANGLFFDKKNNLLACQGGTGKLVSIDPKGKTTVLAENYKTKPFNSPTSAFRPCSPLTLPGCIFSSSVAPFGTRDKSIRQ